MSVIARAGLVSPTRAGTTGIWPSSPGLPRSCTVHPPRCGRVVLLFQPAEETGAGALSVLEDERFESIAPDWIFALHNLPGREPLERFRSGAAHFRSRVGGSDPRFSGHDLARRLSRAGKEPGDGCGAADSGSAGLPDSVNEGDGLAKLTVIHARIGEPAFGTTPGEAEVMATLRSDREGIPRTATGGDCGPGSANCPSPRPRAHAFLDRSFPGDHNHPEAVADGGGCRREAMGSM